MRCRSRSCSRDESSGKETFYTPKDQTPVYGKYHQILHGVDSGIATDDDLTTPTTLPKGLEFLPNFVSSPIAQLFEEWSKPKANFSSSPTKNPFFAIRVQELVPICVALITIGSVIFTMLVLTNALNRQYEERNQKYDSIKYAHQRVLDKIERAIPNVIVDEFGVPLGGKKAAIQFAHDLKNKILEEEDNEKEDNEIINRLSMRVAVDALKILDDLKLQQADKDTKKQILLQKMGQFGHFGTTMVKPLDLNEVVENDANKDDPEKGDDDEVAIKDGDDKLQKPTKHKRDVEMSMKDNPFRIDEKMSVAKREVMDEEDPFRFVRQNENEPFYRMIKNEQ